MSCKLSPAYPKSLTTKPVQQKIRVVTICLLSKKFNITVQCNLMQAVATVNENKSYNW